MKNSQKINRMAFYVIFYHQRLHFAFFNIFLTNCIFLNGRSLLHASFFKTGNVALKIDKILNIFCFFFYWYDIAEMINMITTARIEAITKDIPLDKKLQAQIKKELETQNKKNLEFEASKTSDNLIFKPPSTTTTIP